ncbi:hypothetical protein GDO78_020903, partial [Eleutherodactylus coqui]
MAPMWKTQLSGTVFPLVLALAGCPVTTVRPRLFPLCSSVGDSGLDTFENRRRFRGRRAPHTVRYPVSGFHSDLFFSSVLFLVTMEPSDGSHAPPRPSYLGIDITKPERGSPQELEDIRTNLSQQFLLQEDTVCNSTRNSSLDGKEPMQVYLRIRPFTGTENEQKESQDCVSIPDPCSVLVKPPISSQACRLSDRASSSVAQKFTFTHVFGPETTQSGFFEGTIKKQVTDFMKGHNRLIFTYGVTNAGKTFTFQG